MWDLLDLNVHYVRLLISQIFRDVRLHFRRDLLLAVHFFACKSDENLLFQLVAILLLKFATLSLKFAIVSKICYFVTKITIEFTFHLKQPRKVAAVGRRHFFEVYSFRWVVRDVYFYSEQLYNFLPERLEFFYSFN